MNCKELERSRNQVMKTMQRSVAMGCQVVCLIAGYVGFSSSLSLYLVDLFHVDFD